MAGTVLLFDPTAPCHNEPRDLRQTVDDLRDKVIGFIDNTKPNFACLVDDLAELLAARYGVRAIVRRAKQGPAMPAPDVVIEELANECDLVITGAGD